eukprot:5890462-Pyramimonas_sp.AAC.1
MADASALRLEVELCFLHASGPTRRRSCRCIAGASAVHWRRGAILRPHLLETHLGGLRLRRRRHDA